MVYNTLGQLVYLEDILLEIGNHTLKIPLQNLSAGTYFLKLQTGTKAYTRKFFIAE